MIYKIQVMGETRLVQSGTDDERKMFNAVQNATGLDATMACAILRRGDSIKHPSFKIGVLKGEHEKA